MHLMLEKAELLMPEHFGYRVIHFEHDREHESTRNKENFLGLKLSLIHISRGIEVRQIWQRLVQIFQGQ